MSVWDDQIQTAEDVATNLDNHRKLLFAPDHKVGEWVRSKRLIVRVEDPTGDLTPTLDLWGIDTCQSRYFDSFQRVNRQLRRSAQASPRRAGEYDPLRRDAVVKYNAFIKSHNDDTRIDKIDPSLTQKGVGGQQWMRFDPKDALAYGEPQVRHHRLFCTMSCNVLY